MKQSIFIFIICTSIAVAQPGQSLRLLKRTHISKVSGSVDQVIILPEGGFVIRDSSFRENEEAQSIDIFNNLGGHVRKVGSFGNAPGQYFRLKDLAVDSSGVIWSVDVSGRITRFSQTGQMLGTTLIQKPAFHPTGIGLDERNGVYYLAGCLPLHQHFSEGCSLVHRYGLQDNTFQKSFDSTDEDALRKDLFSLEDYSIAVDTRGNVYLIDAPILKVVVVEAQSNVVKKWPITTKAAPMPALARGLNPKQIHEFDLEHFMIDRIVVLDSLVVVVIREPHQKGYLLQIFTPDGQQVRHDVVSPGRLVGRTNGGALLFVNPATPGFDLLEYSLGPASQPAVQKK